MVAALVTAARLVASGSFTPAWLPQPAKTAARSENPPTTLMPSTFAFVI
jgi:hypothetical protein